MPVDNDKIKTTIQALELKEQKLSKAVSKVRRTRQNLTRIFPQEQEVQDPDDPSKTIKGLTDVMDEAFDKKMSTARRQEIYDYWIAEAETLLA